ncbi:spore coat protein CotJB [Clostridium sp. SM-530-WT-3G]|uniref:spore coat protein CotJB n=1 Tax=Clostridium sp. SM-530-WT-3G TaxID=2725303 RepID=UPI00145D2BF1|nr:spore coat protein CotJB [Clostridium sp. SM-530-WT-3G]NME84086.1 spore coat protein CotJB [Clostridium sp. SM-530-WT-3G]
MNKYELLNSIRIYQFCALDLNLYLDNFPTDENAIDDYCKVSAKLDSLMAEYEKNYGPLRNFGNSFYECPEKWVEQCWPWEQEE